MLEIKTYTGLEFNNLFLSPIIYAWRRQEQWLYIGCSTCGYSRILHHHHIINKRAFISLSDIIQIFYCPLPDLLEVEYQMIREHKPKYNTMSKRPTLTQIEAFIRANPSAVGRSQAASQPFHERRLKPQPLTLHEELRLHENERKRNLRLES